MGESISREPAACRRFRRRGVGWLIRVPTHQTHVIRHDSSLGEWEIAVGRPTPALSPHVSEYVGWVEERFSPGIRRELPSIVIPLIINFGASYRLSDPDDPRRW